MKRCLFLFAISALVAFVVLATIKHAHAVSCNTGAKVCNFIISTGILYNTVCMNGVQSTSMMPNDEDAVKNYVEISDPCGAVWHTLLGVPFEATGSLCGTTAWADCE
ncbi:MAG: hypothetical protein LBS55_11140 [Prevotellaceae bacterium]|nr:hypothetical protein [Prevotellaceae bacterium]